MSQSSAASSQGQLIKPANQYPAIQRIPRNNVSLRSDGCEIICIVCRFIHRYDPSKGPYNIEHHLINVTHVNNLLKFNQSLALSDAASTSYNRDKKHLSLINFIAKSNIPLNVIDNTYFIEFADSNFPFKMMPASTYHKKYIKLLYRSKMGKLKEMLARKPYYIIIDESVDRLGRNILNILVGKCNKQESSDQFLVFSRQIANTTHQVIIKYLKKAQKKLFGANSDPKLFRILISNGSSCMKSTGCVLKEKNQDLKHFTCLCHGLHNLSETIQNNSPLVDEMVVAIKRLLTNNRKNKEIFKRKTGLPILQLPIITRWSTWIKFVNHLYINSNSYSKFLEKMDVKKKTTLKNTFQSEEFEKQITICHQFESLSSIITNLEGNNMSVKSQAQIIKQVKRVIKKNPVIKARYKQILKKNPDIKYFF